MSPDVHAIFVLPPSFEEWNRRRLARYGGEIDEDDNRIRLESAMMEIDLALAKGYYDFVVNDNVVEAAETVKRIVAGDRDVASHTDAETLARALHTELSTH